MSLNDFVDSLTPDQQEKLMEMLKDKQVEEKDDIVVNEDFTVTRETNMSQRKVPVKANKNKWVDEGEFRDPDYDDNDLKRAERSRSKPKKSKVECHVCGKTFKVDSRYTYGSFYRCNGCIGN